MATKIYGTLTGSSSTRYTLWLAVRQNSQSIADNTSNVTVTLCLKRADGYAASAYDLNAGENSVNLSVGGTVRVSGHITIDTRNGVTDTLASWTGDVAHAADGTLALPVAGSFTSGLSVLPAGSASGSFSGTRIPRASTLCLSNTQVVPGGSVSAAVTAASTAFSHKITWKIGSFSAVSSLSAGTLTATKTIPLSWANAVPNAKSAKLSVVLSTYAGATFIGSKSYALNLVIPASEAYLPQFSITVSRENPGVPAEWGALNIQGITRITVNITDAVYKYSASFGAAEVRIDGATLRTLPATLTLQKSGSRTLSVKITDTRGYSQTQTLTLTVEEYRKPTISITKLYRCTADGTQTEDGTCLCAEYAVICSSINNRNAPTVSLSYCGAGDTQMIQTAAPTASPVIFADGSIVKSRSYTVAFGVRDSITTVPFTVTRSLSTASVALNIRPTGNGAAFGRYAENPEMLDSAWIMNLRKGMSFTGSTGIVSADTNGGYLCLGQIKLCWGFVTTATQQNVTREVLIDFPVTYTAPARVFAGPSSGAPGTVFVTARTVRDEAASLTGATLYIKRTDQLAAQTGISWFAIGY